MGGGDSPVIQWNFFFSSASAMLFSKGGPLLKYGRQVSRGREPTERVVYNINFKSYNQFSVKGFVVSLYGYESRVHTHTHTLPLFSFSPCYSLPPSFPSFLPRVINFFLFVRLFASSSFFFYPPSSFSASRFSSPILFDQKNSFFLC